MFLKYKKRISRNVSKKQNEDAKRDLAATGRRPFVSEARRVRFLVDGILRMGVYDLQDHQNLQKCEFRV